MAKGQSGPDQIKVAENFWTIDPQTPVKLKLTKEGVGARQPISVPGLLTKVAQEYPNHSALCYKNINNTWQKITYSKEWFISDLAAIHAGGIIAGIYTTNSAESVQHILESSRSNIVIVDDAKQMEKINAIKKNLPELKAVVQTQPPYAPYVKRENGYYRWAELEEMNVQDVTEEFQKRMNEIAINQCCCLVYTSGTVGNPKGVMLSHDNLTWDSYATGLRLPCMVPGKEVIVSYLPLSHVAAQMVDIFMSMTYAVTVYFADKDALKGSLIRTLQDARPTRLLGVPRVYEKIHEKMLAIGSQSGAIKKVISSWAKSVTLQHHMDQMQKRPSNSLQYKIVKNLIFSKVKEALGLNRCTTMVSAAAPISVEVKKYFMSLDMPLMEAFGMSETSGAHSMTSPDSFNLETIGRQIDGSETMLANPDDNKHGELLMRGRHIFMGYIGDIEKTKEALQDGWLHSGDLAHIDDDGFIYITGRIKELLITAGGENIPPVHIEHLVKAELPAISNAFLIGDKKKFLTMLVALKTDMDPDTGAPRDSLHPETLKLMKDLGVEYTRLSEILKAGPDMKVLKAIEDAIGRANKKAISNAQKIQKFAILPHDFSVATGELGPTLKVKRNVVVKMYDHIIEGFYKD
uniref:long-chain-fatty-acid--CoA ligase n=1 Tax=Culicoides sonorensis TaxID=179676 RepID=A0A336LRK4_CULSO